MRNFVQPGGNITVPAPAAVNSGDGVLVGSLFGIATISAAVNGNVALATEGVFSLNKVSTQAVSVGARLYWDDTAKLVTTTSSGNTLIGVATAAVGNPSGSVNVRLNASF